MAEFTEIKQRQKIDYNFSDGIDFEPASIPEYYTSQEVQRVISMLMAQEAESKELTALRCTSAGRLLTSTLVGAFTSYDSGIEKRTNTSTFILDFTEPKSSIKVFSTSDSYTIQLDKGDEVWGAAINIPNNYEYKVDYATQRILFTPLWLVTPNIVYWEWWV